MFWEFFYTWWIYLRRGFHVIQGCNPPDNIFLVALPFKLLGVKYIFDHHDANPELYFSKYEKRGLLLKVQVWLEKLTYRFSDVVMATNSSYENWRSPGAAWIRRMYSSSATDRTWRHSKRSRRIRPETWQALSGGLRRNYEIQEGLDILLDVACTSRTRDDATFISLVSAEAWDWRDCEDGTGKGLDDMVNFTGRVPDEELLEILSTADVCVNPDKPCEMNDISTMIKIMEYMALGKPIVQFDLKEGRFSAREASLYSDNQNQVPISPPKFFGCLKIQCEERMGEFGRKRVEQELAWEYSVENLLAAYERAFSKRA